MIKVLVAEQKDDIRTYIVRILKQLGYQTVEAGTGEEALELHASHPDTRLALLDGMLPGIDGPEVCRRIRLSKAPAGVILLCDRPQEKDDPAGPADGADDRITMPFSPAELVAHINELLRRMGIEPERTGELVRPPFRLNLISRTLEKNGQSVSLTKVEYALVRLLMRHPGKAFSREEMLDAVWGRDYFGEVKIVDVNIRRLRLKIEDDIQNPRYVLTVWGYGYKWNAE